MKRISLILAIIMCLGIFLPSHPYASANTFDQWLVKEYGNIYYYVNPIPGTNNVIIYGCKPGVTSLVIPEKIEGIPVTAIYERAFKEHATLKHVTIGKNVNAIGYEAFAYCPNLESVTMSDSVETLDLYAFLYCERLTDVTLSNKLTSVPEGTLQGCTSLKNVNIPSSATKIGFGAFAYCTNLTDIEIPATVSVIEGSAFSDCASLTELNITGCVGNIGGQAFFGCTGLTEINISSTGDVDIAYDAFDLCSNLKSIDISGNSITIGQNGFMFARDSLIKLSLSCTGDMNIGDRAFYDCKIPELNLSGGKISIGTEAFCNCQNLTDVKITANEVSIGQNAFLGANALSDVNIHSDKTTIGTRAFFNMDNLTNVSVWGNASIGEEAFMYSYALADVYISGNVTGIGNHAFHMCYDLPSVSIAGSSSNISDTAFDGCYELTLYGKKGSYLQSYASQNGIPFAVLNEREEPEEKEDLKTVEVKKSETSTTWSFDVSVEDFEGVATAYAVIYDENGKMLTSSLDDLVSGKATLNVSKEGNSDAEYTKVLVWDDELGIVSRTIKINF